MVDVTALPNGAGRTLSLQGLRTTARVGAVLLPVATCAILYRFREDVPSATSALILVLWVVAAAASGDRLAGLLAAISAGAAFDFFLTAPYLRFTIEDPDDIQAAVLLVLIGIAVTEVALWGHRQQAGAARRSGYLKGVLGTARAVSEGDTPPDVVVEVVARQIAEVLGADSCRFVAGPIHDARIALLDHEGTVTRGGRAVDVDRSGCLPTSSSPWSYDAIPGRPGTSWSPPRLGPPIRLASSAESPYCWRTRSLQPLTPLEPMSLPPVGSTGRCLTARTPSDSEEAPAWLLRNLPDVRGPAGRARRCSCSAGPHAWRGSRAFGTFRGARPAGDRRGDRRLRVYEEDRRRPGRVPLERAAARPPARNSGFVWIGLQQPTAEEIAAVAAEFGLPALAVEDAVKAHQRPKLEMYEGVVFVVLKPVRYVDHEEVVDVSEIAIFLGLRFVVTVRHGDSEVLGRVRAELDRGESELPGRGPAAVLYRAADLVVDGYEEVIG